MSYPTQPGYPPRYGVPPGYGYAPAPPSTAPAYLAVALYLGCAVISFGFAGVSWDGTPDNVDALAAVIGIVFSDDLTGNVDFGIAATMTVACTTATFALVLMARLEPVRWILAVVGGIVTAYYVYALIYLLSHDGGEVIGLVVMALLLWLAATVVALLPVTGRAMRAYQRRFGR